MSDLREAIERGWREAHDAAYGTVVAPNVLDCIQREVEAYLREHDAQPNLGLATTHELITELMARADVAKTVGETWPLYSTVSGEPDRKPIALGGTLDDAVVAEHQAWREHKREQRQALGGSDE